MMAFSRQAFRFLVVGGTGTLIDMALFSLLVFGGVVPWPANILSYSCSAFCSFWLHRNWTFEARDGETGRQAWRFAAMIGAGLLLSTMIVWTFAPLLGPLLAKLLAVCGTLVLNFTLSRWLVFAARPAIPTRG
jgi:putative flippase GtrA